jgi:hypothetical protein
LYVPTHNRPASDPFPAALLSGTVVVDRITGCLWIEGAASVRYLVLWPQGYEAHLVNDAWQVIDGTGATRAVENASVTIGGGEFNDANAVRDLIGEDPPVACVTGEYWITPGA